MDRTEALIQIKSEIADGQITRLGRTDISELEKETNKVMEFLEVDMGCYFED